MADLKDSNIVPRLKSGDRTAFTQLLNEFGDRVFNLAKRILHNQLDAEDVVQETFSAVYQNIESFQEGSSLFTWIYRIATNFALMKLRKEKKAVMVSEDFEQYDPDAFHPFNGDNEFPDQAMLDNEMAGELEQALDRIPEKYRTVFILRDLENLSTSATAEILEITEVNVKVRLRRARLYLRDELCAYFERCK